MTRFTLWLMLGIGWSSALLAQSLPPDCGKVTLVFGNGVYGAQTATAYAGEMKTRFAQYAGPAVAATLTDPEVAVNSSGGYLADLIELGRQEGYAEGSIWAVITGVARFATPTVVEALEVVTTRLADPQATEADIDTQVNRYRDLVATGRKVVVVAHSQGNYFSNAALDPARSNGLTASELKAIGVVPVGSPDHYARRRFVEHIRIGNNALGGVPDDEVIYWASIKREIKGLEKSLLANTGDPYEEDIGPYLTGYGGTVVLDGWRHSFLDAYFYSNSDSEEKILKGIVDSIAAVSNPNCSAPPPNEAVVLDQHNDTPSNLIEATLFAQDPGTLWQQTVTVARQGRLAEIEIFFQPNAVSGPALSDAIELSLSRAVAPYPSVEVPFVLNASVVSGWNRFDVSGAALGFSPGDQFTIGLRGGLGTTPGTYSGRAFGGTVYALASGDPYYPNGDLYANGNPFPFGPATRQDMAFRTYVNPTPASEVQVDQWMAIDGNGGVPVQQSESVAQTFTSSVAGRLVQLDIALLTQPAAVGEILLDIRSVVNGAPSSTVLYSTQFPTSAVRSGGPPYHYTPINVSAASLSVTPGGQLALVLSRPADTGGNVIGVASDKPYAGGSLFVGPSSNGPWSLVQGLPTLSFRTYVAPD